MSTFGQTTSGDLALTNGRLTVVTDPSEAAAIKIRNLFLLGKGEYFADTRVGVPYFDFLFVKNPDLGIIRQLFRKVLFSCESVVEVLELTVTYDASARELDYTFRARLDTGKVIAGGSAAPFIVEAS